MERLKLLDKYITKQLIETFLLGIIIFTSIMFASDTFLNLVKQISSMGISFKIALLIIILKLPSILVLTIPMGVLLSSILTFNKLSTNSEIAIMRACGISIIRLALPVLVFGIAAALLSFGINEFIVPAANVQARNLTAWSIEQKSIPEGKTNFSFKEMSNNDQLKRLYYIDKCSNKKLQGVTILDLSKKGALQIIQSKYGSTNPDYWNFNQGVIYTISNSGKVLNTTVFNRLKLYTSFNLARRGGSYIARELSFFDLAKYIETQKMRGETNISDLVIQLQEKIAIPITAILVALIGVPLAITPPRARFNRGILFSILVIFCYYVMRALSISLGAAQILDPTLSAWLPNIIIATVGSVILYRKAYLI